MNDNNSKSRNSSSYNNAKSSAHSNGRSHYQHHRTQYPEVPFVSRKIAVLGARLAGKTSLINEFCHNTFAEDSYEPTIEATFFKTMRFQPVNFSVEIIDTAGMEPEQHHHITASPTPTTIPIAASHLSNSISTSSATAMQLSRNASLGVHGYVLVFSVLSRPSWELIRHVNRLILTTLGNVPDVPRVLVGSMIDVAAVDGTEYTSSGGGDGDTDARRAPTQPQSTSQATTQRQVTVEEGQALAKELGGVPYVECSSKTGEGVNEVFIALVKEIERDDGLPLEDTHVGVWQACHVM